jgi:hypothetical protein
MRDDTERFIADVEDALANELRARLYRQLRSQSGPVPSLRRLFDGVVRQYDADISAKASMAEARGDEKIAAALDATRCEVLPDIVSGIRASLPN